MIPSHFSYRWLTPYNHMGARARPLVVVRGVIYPAAVSWNALLTSVERTSVTDSDLTFTPAWQLRQLIGNKKLSAVELTELFLSRIQALNPKLNAYLTVTADQALASAREAEAAVLRGEDLGPLHGVPISIKDLALTQGIRTTMGSLLYKDFVPDEDDVIVRSIRRAGAIILGKRYTRVFGHIGTS